MHIYCIIKDNFPYTFHNLRYWIDALLAIPDARLCLVVDNGDVLSRLETMPPDFFARVEVLHGAREDIRLRGLLGESLSERWRDAGILYMAAFLHAHDAQREGFWAIDADALYLAASPQKLREIMEGAKHLSQEEGIHALALDIYDSRYGGMQWGFGFAYIDNALDWFSLIRKYGGVYRESLLEKMGWDWSMGISPISENAQGFP